MKNKIYSKLIILLALVLCLAACDGAVHLPESVTPVVVTFKITFDGNGATSGTPMDQMVVNAGTTIKLPYNTYVYPDPPHDDKAFEGWALTPDGEVIYEDEADITPENDITLFAKWIASR